MAEGTALKIVSNSRILDAATNISMTGSHSGVIHLSAPKLINGTVLNIAANQLTENGHALTLKSSIDAGSLMQIEGQGNLLNIINKNVKGGTGIDVELQAGIGMLINSNSEKEMLLILI